MTRTVEIPLWLLALILAFAAVTAATHLLFPSVRWFFRRRMERAVERLNRRLERPIEPFKLARRHDTIQRLAYDPQVMAAVAELAARQGIPENVAAERARRHAREIVPAFSAAAYFGFATRAARRLSRFLYEVCPPEERPAAPPGAAVVFVMNHRSNMDYVLVTYLAAEVSALAFAIGEWARVWPLSRLLRAMGGYFIRRGAVRGPEGELYRRVLARYVQMATEGGVTQALYPEGGLSLDGRIGPPKLGVLSYVMGARVEGARDAREVVFVPVAINYDRVLEDRILMGAAARGERRFGGGALAAIAVSGRYLAGRLLGRRRRFGAAAVAYGAPLALSEFPARGGGGVEALGAELMGRIAAAMPVLPVPLLARVLARGPAPAAALPDLAVAEGRALARAGARLALPEGAMRAGAARGLAELLRRGIVAEAPGGRLAVREPALIAFYAASIAHLAPEAEPEPAAAAG